MRALGIAVVLAATLAAFSPLAVNQFVNYDDPSALLQNEHLTSPGVVPWAFTTDLLGHFQPLSWLVWSAVRRVFGPNPVAFHALSLFTHVLNALLVGFLTTRLAKASANSASAISADSAFSAVTAALLFAIHPTRAEPVAWASAFPYALALLFLLLSAFAYVRAGTSDDARARWFALSVGCYLLSLLSRPVAIGFPLVLVALDWYPLRGGRRLVEKTPFVLLAIAAAFLEFTSREVAGLQEISFGARATIAATAPFVYLGRLVWAVGRSPIEAMPIAAQLESVPLFASIAGLVAITIATWRLRHSAPALLTAWASFLLLLAPVMGLTPSGQQVVADRYVYMPAVAIAVVAGIAIGRAVAFQNVRWPSIAAVGGIVVVLGVTTWRQTTWWHDSITMWTRSADLNPRNDIATYNLAVALAEAGRDDEAATRYQQTLRLIPDHEPARRALVGIHARRGMASVTAGKFADAVEDLRVAALARPDDRALASGLAFALMQTGRAGEAAGVLKRSLALRPDDDELAHNLARLLATTDDPAVRDGATALRLALAVRERLGSRDPRVLDTLAAAYAAAGDITAARKTAQEAVALARQLGQGALADEISAHARAYNSPAR